MISINREISKSIFDNDGNQTLHLEHRDLGLYRTILQKPLWSSGERPYPMVVSKILIPDGLIFPHQENRETMQAHAALMRDYALKVQSGKATWRPMICITDMHRVWVAMHLETRWAGLTLGQNVQVPTIVFSGGEYDAQKFIIDSGAATLRQEV